MCTYREVNDTLCPDETGGVVVSPIIAMTDSVDDEFSVHLASETSEDLESILKKFVSRQSHGMEELIDFLQQYGAGLGPDTVATKFKSQYGEEKVKSRIWYDVTRSPLPHAPNMNIFCLYGTGLPTERAYYYKRNWVEASDGKQSANNITEPVVIIDSEVNDDGRNISLGVRYSDGDGSVPLISLGYVCADAWQRKNSGLNPSNTNVYTREYMHKSEFHVEDPMRGGPSSSDHGMPEVETKKQLLASDCDTHACLSLPFSTVDILGNVKMMEDFIRIVTDFNSEEVRQDSISSEIREIAEKINSRGGLFKRKEHFWMTSR